MTRLLRQAAGRRVQLTFYEDGLNVACDWCTILEFDGVWANVEFARKRRDWRETQLVPLASIRSITFLKDEGKGGEARKNLRTKMVNYPLTNWESRGNIRPALKTDWERCPSGLRNRS